MPAASSTTRSGAPSRPRHRAAQRGYVAAILLVFVTLGALAGLLSQLNAVSTARGVDAETGSGSLLGDVRDALRGWAANHPDRPGGLPCPDTNNDGFAETACDTEASRLGLVPWRTLALPTRPVADGEPLWYAIAPAYRVQATYTDPNFAINIASADPLNPDRRPIQVRRPGATGAVLAQDVAAVVIAPGIPILGQSRPTGSVDVTAPAKYLEGRNASTTDGDLFDIGDFADAFNDRVLMLRTNDLFEVVEPVIEQRLRSTAFWDEFRRHNHVPAQDAIYPCAPTPCTPHRFHPFAVPFTNPATTPFRELVWTEDRGLLPVGLLSTDLVWTSFSAAHMPGPVGTVSFTPLPNRDVIVRLSGASSPVNPAVYTVTLDLPNAGRGFLQSIELPTVPLGSVATITSGPTTSTNVSGVLRLAFTVSFTNGPPVDITVRAARLNPALSTEAPVAFGQPTAWFMRNQWYRFVYYSIAWTSIPGSTGLWSCPGAGCLAVTYANVPSRPAESKDMVLVYMGRALATQNRASTPAANQLGNYLDTPENTNLDVNFEQRVVRNAANDRVAYDPRP